MPTELGEGRGPTNDDPVVCDEQLGVRVELSPDECASSLSASPPPGVDRMSMSPSKSHCEIESHSLPWAAE